MTKNLNVYITAILPAHNEGDGITEAVDSIKQYADNIIVACDNCTDETMANAKLAGADVTFNTVNNDKRKAGALNQALKKYVDWSIPNHYCLIMDADTKVIDPELWFTKATSLIYPNRPKMSSEALNMNAIKRNWLRIFDYKKIMNYLLVRHTTVSAQFFKLQIN